MSRLDHRGLRGGHAPHLQLPGRAHGQRLAVGCQGQGGRVDQLRDGGPPFAAGQVPPLDRPGGRLPGREERFAVGQEVYAGDCAVAVGELPKFLAGRHVPQAKRLVGAPEASNLPSGEKAMVSTVPAWRRRVVPRRPWRRVGGGRRSGRCGTEGATAWVVPKVRAKPARTCRGVDKRGMTCSFRKRETLRRLARPLQDNVA